MKITQVSINFQETCNLGDYSNTKPGIELTANVEPADDIHTVIDHLVGLAKEVLHAKVDEELELVGRPPKYYTGPLYDVLYGYTTRFVAIVPAGSIKKLDGSFYRRDEGVRYEVAYKSATKNLARDESDCVFFDCASVDLALLLAYTTEQAKVIEQREAEMRQRQEAEWAALQKQEAEPEEDFYEDDSDDSGDDDEE